MGISILVSTCAFLGLFGPVWQALSAFVGLAVALGRRAPDRMGHKGKYISPGSPMICPKRLALLVCENIFETE